MLRTIVVCGDLWHNYDFRRKCRSNEIIPNFVSPSAVRFCVLFLLIRKAAGYSNQTFIIVHSNSCIQLTICSINISLREIARLQPSMREEGVIHHTAWNTPEAPLDRVSCNHDDPWDPLTKYVNHSFFHFQNPKVSKCSRHFSGTRCPHEIILVSWFSPHHTGGVEMQYA